MNWSNFVIVLAGGYLQQNICQEAKRRGFDLLLIDGNSGCYCRKYADEFRCIDTYDLYGCKDLCYELLAKQRIPKAILTDSADVGIIISHMCQIFDLTSTPVDIAEKINNKANLLKTLRGAYTPLSMDASNMTALAAYKAWSELCDFWSFASLPVVFKAKSNCGSRGVVKIDNEQEWFSNFATIDEFQKYGEYGVLIQEYIDGPEVATDWFVSDGKPVYINGAERIFDGFGRELGHINPYWPVPKQIYDATLEICKRAGYNYGPLKVDFIYCAEVDLWLILEAATRWSGGFDHGFTAKLVTDRNLEKPLLDFALGQKVDLPGFDGIFTNYAAALGLYYTDGYDINKISSLPPDIEIHVTGNLGSACAARNLWLLTKDEDKGKTWQRLLQAKQTLMR